MILLVIKVRQNVKLLMLSAFTLKIHIKSPSKIQTRSQTCKQFKKWVAVTITEYRCNVDMRKKIWQQVRILPLPCGIFIVISSLRISGQAGHSAVCVCVRERHACTHTHTHTHTHRRWDGGRKGQERGGRRRENEESRRDGKEEEVKDMRERKREGEGERERQRKKEDLINIRSFQIFRN